MNFLKPLLTVFVLLYLAEANGLLFINESEYTLSVYDFEQKLTDIIDCAEINDEVILNTEKLIVQIDKINIFYSIVPCQFKSCCNIIVFKNGGYETYSAKILQLEAKCENKDSILKKIKDLEDNNKLSKCKDVSNNHHRYHCKSCLPKKNVHKICNIV